MLKSIKDHIDPQQQIGVYKITCPCSKAYIGETGCSFDIRIKDHGADLTHNPIKIFSLAKHSHKTKHHISLWKSSKDPRDSWQQKHIYKIMCPCSKLYIRETDHLFVVRIKEHGENLAHSHIKTLTLAEPSHKNNIDHRNIKNENRI